MKMKRRLLWSFLIGFFCISYRLLPACSIEIATAKPEINKKSEEGLHQYEILSPLQPDEISVDSEIGRRFKITAANNLLALDLNDFFIPFEEKKLSKAYIGIGKLIDAAVHFAVNCKNSEDKDKVITLKDEVIGRLLRAQSDDGYIGCLNKNSRIKKEYDLHELGYIILGLSQDYRYFKNKRSLNAAVSVTEYLINHWKEAPHPNMTTLGVAEGLFSISSAADNPRYSSFAENMKMGKHAGFNLREWAIYPGEGKNRAQNHSYRWLERCLMQLELYSRKPDLKLLRQSQNLLRYLLKENGLLVTGTCSSEECWHNDQKGEGEIGETCVTAYLIRVLEKYIRITGEQKYADIIERAVYNSLFAAQSPDGRHLRYFTPFEGKKQYYDKDIYCCPNNFRRIIAELPEMIYYKWRNGLAVNLYTSSSIEISLSNDIPVIIQQETDYPNSGKVTLYMTIKEPAVFPLRFRIPQWCESAEVKINNEKLCAAISGSFHIIERKWKNGDRIQLNMPMKWRWIKGRILQRDRCVLLRGPQVFCLNAKRNQLPDEMEFLKKIVIDNNSIIGPFSDNSVRPRGVACKVKAWKSGQSMTSPPELELMLTEFADPDGILTYFQISDPQDAIDDEL